MQEEISSQIGLYQKGLLNRRELLRSLIALTGSYTTAHLFLESSGLAATLLSQVETQASNVDSEPVRYSSGQFQIEGYLSKPKGSGKHPGIILIHENRGLNEHIRDVAPPFSPEDFFSL